MFTSYKDGAWEKLMVMPEVERIVCCKGGVQGSSRFQVLYLDCRLGFGSCTGIGTLRQCVSVCLSVCVCVCV